MRKFTVRAWKPPPKNSATSKTDDQRPFHPQSNESSWGKGRGGQESTCFCSSSLCLSPRPVTFIWRQLSSFHHLAHIALPRRPPLPHKSTATPTTHLATRTMVLPTLTSQPPSGSTKRVCIARESRLVCLRGNRGRGRKGGGRLKKRGRREDAKGEEVGATT